MAIYAPSALKKYKDRHETIKIKISDAINDLDKALLGSGV